MFVVARNVPVETGGERIYLPRRGNLKATKRGEQDKSPKKFESSESGRERGIDVNWSNVSRVSQSIGAYLAVSGQLFRSANAMRKIEDSAINP